MIQVSRKGLFGVPYVIINNNMPTYVVKNKKTEEEKEILCSYEKRKEWVAGQGERSLTYAICVGDEAECPSDKIINKALIAFIQPTEPESQSSHVRTMLKDHRAAAHWQHIALRTPDLMAFHEHALKHGVRFITPIMKEDDDTIQIFSGEWYYPGSPASGLFFEFVQRNVTSTLLKRIEERNRETWFNDYTFMGLYGEKEKEYQSGNVTPFIDFALFDQLKELIGNRHQWEITEEDVSKASEIMQDYAKKYPQQAN